MSDEENHAVYATKLNEDVRALIRKEMLEAFMDGTSGVSYTDMARWLFVMCETNSDFKRAVYRVMKDKFANDW